MVTPEKINVHDGKVCLVTGSSRGIGKTIAKGFAEARCKIVINCLSNAEVALQTMKEIKLEYPNCEVMMVKADVSLESEVSNMIEQIIGKFGTIDILVSNAGINVDSVIWKMTKDEWDRVISTNLTGAFLCTKHVIPIMRKNNWGRIIYISSVASQTGLFGASNYAASKAGLLGLAKSVAREVANRNITVNVVACGYMDTGMGSRLSEEIRRKALENILMGRFGTAKEVADLVVFLSKAAYITGQIIHINGGLA